MVSRKIGSKRFLEKRLKVIHGKKSDHKCYSCGNTFTDLSYLKRHIKTIHDRQKKNTKLVILVGNPSLPQEIWDFTLIQFIKFRKIICVNFFRFVFVIRCIENPYQNYSRLWHIRQTFFNKTNIGPAHQLCS